MEIVCRTLGIILDKYQKKGISNIKEAGFTKISLELEENLHSYQTITNDIDFKIAYASNDINLLEKSIEIASQNHCGYVVIKPTMIDEEFYIKVGKIAEKNNIVILLENIDKNINGRYVRGEFSDANKLSSYIDKFNQVLGKEIFGVCLDIGICKLCKYDICSYISCLGKRIKAVKIRDCESNNNSSLVPFSSVSNGVANFSWSQLIHALRDIDYDDILMLDIEDTVKAVPALLEKELLFYSKKIMDFFEKQIKVEELINKTNNIVVFGAGYTGKEFVNKYVNTGKIKFICDNNSNLWGKSIMGIEIKNPNELNDEYRIFVCNMYYKEIEQQLFDMGIKNFEFYL